LKYDEQFIMGPDVRVMVIGAAGRLGAAVVEAFADAVVASHNRATLDVTNPDAIARAVDAASPNVIVNCAAFNHVDLAEDQPDEALAVNAFAVRSLARAAETHDATLVHYSTDFVFDGTATEPYEEDARPSPRSTYASTKLLGEWFALDAPRSFVLRVESLFGQVPGWTGRAGTLDTIVSGIEARREVKVFTDRVVSPGYVPDIAAATRHLVTSAAQPGLYHCVNSGCATWAEVAQEAARVLGIEARLQPVTTNEVALKASRPRFCALANRKLGEAGYPMPNWQDGLRRWIMSRTHA
jgi:dTDP-4-dehydrorhamnose reductase